jgi:hypothetical protein
MIPTYEEITKLESTLIAKTEQVGGEGEGLGCILVKTK